MSSRDLGQKVRQKRVTIDDLSAHLGLAKGTVSRALNNYPDISDRTKRRVEREAKRLGYRPLSHAQAIKTGRVRALGLVIDTTEPDTYRPFLTDFLDGISRAASAEGWSLTIATALNAGGVIDAIGRLSEERKADGFILPRTRWSDARVRYLRESGTPFILYGRTNDPTDCAWFDISSEDAIRDAVLRLARFGHRRIAFLNFDSAYTTSRLRLQGFESGMAQAGLQIDRELMRDGITDEREGFATALDMLAADERPTAFVCAIDRAALGVYAAARERGLAIGSDVSVIGYDGVLEGALATPALTTFAVDLRAAGARLAELLIKRIRGADPTTLRVTAQARLVPGGSDGPPSPS